MIKIIPLYNNIKNWIDEITIHYIEENQEKNWINFTKLKHLDAIWLISFESTSGYQKTDLPQNIKVFHKNIDYKLTFKTENKNNLNIGFVILTSIGEELASICTPENITGFDEYIIKKWTEEGIEITNLTHPTNPPSNRE